MTIFKRLGILPYLLLLSAITVQAQRHSIKLATLAPDGSSWVTAVRAIDKDIREATQGEVGFKIYPGGVQGDEDVMLRKIRVGQIHAGGFAGMGLSQVLPDILATEVPFLFDNYAEVDYVRQQMDTYYRARLKEAGFVLLGWVDVGFVHILSQKPVRRVDDIRHTKVWRIESDPLTASIFKRAGVNSVPLAIPDVLLGLQTNLVEVVYAPPTAAIVLQWFTRAKYVTRLPINYTNGALLIARKRFERLEPQQQKHLVEISARHLLAQSQTNRKDNAEALQVMQGQGLEIVEPDSAAIQSFEDMVSASLPDLVGKAFSEEAHELVREHLRQFRQANE